MDPELAKAIRNSMEDDAELDDAELAVGIAASIDAQTLTEKTRHEVSE